MEQKVTIVFCEIPLDIYEAGWLLLDIYGSGYLRSWLASSVPQFSADNSSSSPKDAICSAEAASVDCWHS